MIGFSSLSTCPPLARRARGGLFGVIVLFMLGCGQFIFAAEPVNSARSEIDPKVSELLGFIGAGRIDAMLDRIGPIPDNDRPLWEKTRDRLINFYDRAGPYSGFDIAGYKPLTPRYQAVFVLVYFEKRPVMFEFEFYQVNNVWRPQTFKLETDFKPILDEMPLQK